MEISDIIALAVTAVGVVSFAALFTILYRSYSQASIAEYVTGKRDVELIEETIFENINSKKRYRRLYRRIKQITFYVLIAVLVPFLVFSVLTRFTDGVFMPGGRGMIAVASGSMEEINPKNPNYSKISTQTNQFDTYDVIFIKKVDYPSELKILDVIAFTDKSGTNIIHRIVDIEFENGELRYVTCGDNNTANDSYRVPFDKVLGKYDSDRIPLVGIFVMFLQSYSGIVTILAIIYCLIMIELVNEKMFRAQNGRLEILAASIDFKEETVPDEKMGTKFIEKVTYKDYIYVFDENGFVRKDKVTDAADTADGSLQAASVSEAEGSHKSVNCVSDENSDDGKINAPKKSVDAEESLPSDEVEAHNKNEDGV